jgi:N-acetylmuramoyl-L-alanine amidase
MLFIYFINNKTLNLEKPVSSMYEKTDKFSQSNAEHVGNTNNKNNKSNVVVVIDPGHGGRDPGATSPYVDGFYEKEVTLDIGLKLKDKLERAGIKVVMTRESDIELDSNLKEDTLARSRIANESNGTLFISIHVNSFDIKINDGDSYNGTEIYYFKNSYGDSANEDYARAMGEEIDKVTGTAYNGIKKANYSVLRMTKMPALLIETAYITNREDHKLLESSEFREDMAEGIFRGTIRILEIMGFS